MRKKPKTIPYRRKREGKTNYRQRLKLLKMGKPRLVIRPSLKNITVQLVEFEPKGDKVLLCIYSSKLNKLGWKGATGNIPAAYLCGYWLGLEAQKKAIKEAVLDMGWKASTKGNRVYACLKGALDSGLKVNHSKDILPAEERIKGQHINEETTKMFEKIKKTMEGEK